MQLTAFVVAPVHGSSFLYSVFVSLSCTRCERGLTAELQPYEVLEAQVFQEHS